MFRIIIFVVAVFCAWRWGDWQKLNRYYPTLLFSINCGLLYNVLLDNHLLWRYEPVPPLNNILFNNEIIDLAVTFISFPAFAFTYLSNYPYGKKQYLYIILWVIFLATIELITFKQNGISYHNGWNLGWSIVFDFAIFSFLRLHYIKPILAWFFSLILIIVIFIVFDISIKEIY
ncbi:hypothetical protein L7E55_02250 [Pelotomaculum isophthalicicum JI]|uniref:Uncharacterized protein n=1 Tax=Pelotomaculum isophthalicicum JI TaxID=947010 RepID=A0A9X4H0Y7_9FIRM|nr:CBO0543 family protein [Pelotomaculum isophthalicicum]MDF9407186.1 hypothetical protein [Pelotomaculum isophthalicicum JI]